MGRRRVGLAAACLAALLVAGCSGAGGATADRAGERGRLRVVATTTQVADLAANVGGDRVRVTSLLKPGIDPHDYEPSPADIDAIAHADLVLENGVGLEAWLSDTIDSSGFDGPVVDTRQLQALDAEVQRQVDSLANRKVVTDHDAFGFYLDRYGLELVGSVIPSFDSSAELSGRDIRDLVAKVRATGVKVVTGDDALYGDALGPPGSDGDTYIKMIRHNTATIVSNLSGT